MVTGQEVQEENRQPCGGLSPLLMALATGSLKSSDSFLVVPQQLKAKGSK